MDSYFLSKLLGISLESGSELVDVMQVGGSGSCRESEGGEQGGGSDGDSSSRHDVSPVGRFRKIPGGSRRVEGCYSMIKHSPCHLRLSRLLNHV